MINRVINPLHDEGYIAGVAGLTLEVLGDSEMQELAPVEVANVATIMAYLEAQRAQKLHYAPATHRVGRAVAELITGQVHDQA